MKAKNSGRAGMVGIVLQRAIVALAAMAFCSIATAQESSATAQEPSADATVDELLEQLSTNDSEVGALQPSADPSPAGLADAVPAGPAPNENPLSEENPQASSAEAQLQQELEMIPIPQPKESRAPALREPPQGRQIEEVVVTAQKREQVSQDVPISMTVLSDTFIHEQGLTDVSDALLFVPNFKVLEFANSVTPQCRGFVVNEANPAFEPPCGFALDGVAFARAAYFESGLFDLKRMEVLRGPQGTTFGKNTTAGVISLYSKDPTDEFTANVALQYGLEGASQRRVEIGAGGPLVPGVVNFRVAGMLEDRGGYMENTYYKTDPSVGKDAGGRERATYRIKLTFPDVLGSQVKLLHERSDLTATGSVTKVSAEEGSAWATYLRGYDPNIDFGENYKTSNLGAETHTIITRSQGEWLHEIDGWGITLVGATGELTREFNATAPPYPVEVVRSMRQEESPFVTAELRATSPDFDGLFGLESLFGIDLGTSNLLAGVFAQRQEIARLHAHSDLYFIGLTGLLLAGNGVPVPATPQLEALSRELFGNNLSEYYESTFSQKAETLALFSQFTWNMTEKWSADLGVRLSKETKEGHWQTGYSAVAPTFNPTQDRAFTADRTIDNATIQPKVSLSYKLTDDINLFAHWAQAFKSGGFNFYTPRGNPEKPNPSDPNAQTGSLSYDDEVATEWGFDAKMRLFDNQMQLNISLFRLDVDDFQVLTDVAGTEVTPSTNLPNGYQEVVNAASARAQGAEVDLTWLATDWLTLIGSIGYNDTEYLSFKSDACSGTEDTPDPETNRCDRTGEAFLGAPKLGGALTLDARFPLGGLWPTLGDLQMLLGGTAEYVGSMQPYGGTYDSISRQESYFRYRAHAGLSNPTQGWDFRVTALNITNDYLATKVESSGLTTMVPSQPRTIYAQFSWNY